MPVVARATPWPANCDRPTDEDTTNDDERDDDDEGVRMAGFLSDEWLDGLDLGAGRGDEKVPAVRVRRLVTGGPEGDLTFESVVPGTDGSVPGGPGAPGAELPGAELTLTTTYAVASELDVGDVTPAVAYMQGRLKAEGDMPTLYALLAATT
jgi:hypothetical protein